VEILIQTSQWFPQGSAEVQEDGTWELPTAWFGGSRHIVQAVLEDKNGNTIHTAEINVRVVH